MFNFRRTSAMCGQAARRAQRVLAAGALVVACSAPCAVLCAQSQPPLTLDEAERLALDREPGQVAYEARAEALGEQAIAAAQLPDPKLRLGLANYPTDGGGFSAEAMTQAQVGFQQMFPPGQSRAAGARRFSSLAREMTESADARGRDVLSGVRTAWLESYYWERAHGIIAESRPFFADLVTVTRSLYAVGRRSQQDVLRSELELSRLEDRLIEIDRQGARARASLAEWLPDDAHRPIDESLPQWETPSSLAELKSKISAHPALLAADARVAAQDAEIDLARERFKPGWTLDVGYGYRRGLLPSGAPRSDMLSVAVMVDLPFFRKDRQDRMLAAAVSQRRAADESREQLSRRLMSQLEAEYARWQDLTRRIDLYDRLILEQTKDHAQAALLAYQSDAGDFADVMRGSIDELNTRLDRLRLQVERAESYAVLANLGGFLQ